MFYNPTLKAIAYKAAIICSLISAIQYIATHHTKPFAHLWHLALQIFNYYPQLLGVAASHCKHNAPKLYIALYNNGYYAPIPDLAAGNNGYYAPILDLAAGNNDYYDTHFQ